MIASKARVLPQATIFYSPPGVGKTELAAHYDKPVFIMVGLELGLITLINTGRVPETPYWDRPVESWPQLHDALNFVLNEPHDHKTLVIDTANGAQRLLKMEVIINEFDNDESKFESYGKGWERSLGYWVDFLNKLQAIRIKRGMRVVLLVHSLVTNFRNPEGDDYQKHSPELQEKHIWNPTNAWADNVFFMDMEVNTVQVKGTNRSKGKKGREHRQLYVESTPSHFAKNRFGLRQPISMGSCGREGFANLVKAIEGTRAQPPKTETKKPSTETKQPTDETKVPPAEPKQAPSETAAAPVGPPWVQTLYSQIKACDKIGPSLSIFNDLAGDYSSAVEPDQVEYFPGLFMAWLEHCLSLGGKAAEQVQKKLTGKHDLPIRVIDPLFTRLNQGQAA